MRTLIQKKIGEMPVYSKNSTEVDDDHIAIENEKIRYKADSTKFNSGQKYENRLDSSLINGALYNVITNINSLDNDIKTKISQLPRSERRLNANSEIINFNNKDNVNLVHQSKTNQLLQRYESFRIFQIDLKNSLTKKTTTNTQTLLNKNCSIAINNLTKSGFLIPYEENGGGEIVATKNRTTLVKNTQTVTKININEDGFFSIKKCRGIARTVNPVRFDKDIKIKFNISNLKYKGTLIDNEYSFDNNCEFLIKNNVVIFAKGIDFVNNFINSNTIHNEMLKCVHAF